LKPFLEVRHLRKSFGQHLVVDIESLDIRKGEIISILGPSGCGKTTFLRLLAGFDHADQGHIQLCGQDISELAPNKRRINTVFQNYALFPHFTVFENIAFGLHIAKLPGHEIQKRVEEMLKLIQLKEMAHKYPHQISGGQKQRVAIARALVLKPDILLLDEPLAALDLKLRQRMLLELDLIHDEVGISFVFITHDQSEAMSISDRIAIMNNGRIEQIGTPREIYEAPCNNFVAAFIGDSNFFEGSLSKKSRDDDYVNVDIEGLGTVACVYDRRMELSEYLYLGLRPEKIHISKTRPQANDALNTLEATVEDIIYLGPQTKYWVRVGTKRLIVLQQHDHFLSNQDTITWTDTVWIQWEPDDGFILERFIQDTPIEKQG
jgi:spermidine/putrescine transport system ATP-binding protein